jgi:hypothetical protein
MRTDYRDELSLQRVAAEAESAMREAPEDIDKLPWLVLAIYKLILAALTARQLIAGQMCNSRALHVVWKEAIPMSFRRQSDSLRVRYSHQQSVTGAAKRREFKGQVVAVMKSPFGP